MEKVEISKRRIINWELLPWNVVKIIFSKLTFSNLPICRLVCKTWNDLVLDYASSSKFLPNAFLVCTSEVIPNSKPGHDRCNPKMHCMDFDTMNYVASFKFDNEEEDWTTISIVNSCNGLLFISKYTFEKWWDGILNPMTNEFIKLPQVDEDIYLYGFGFSLVTKEYKLFRFSNHEDQTKCSSIMEICIFNETSGSNQLQLQWIPHRMGTQPFIVKDQGAYLDGVIYWIGKGIGNEFVIFSLNVESERIEFVYILGVSSYSTLHDACIHPLNDTIYATISMRAPFWKIDVWKMVAKDSWIREFVIDLPNNLRLKAFYLIKAFEGRIMFLINNDI